MRKTRSYAEEGNAQVGEKKGYYAPRTPLRCIQGRT